MGVKRKRSDWSVPPTAIYSGVGFGAARPVIIVCTVSPLVFFTRDQLYPATYVCQNTPEAPQLIRSWIT